MYEIPLPAAGSYEEALLRRWAQGVAQAWGLKVAEVRKGSWLKGRRAYLRFEGPSYKVAEVEALWMTYTLAA